MPKLKQAALTEAGLTDYEAQRQKRIERNKEMLQSLGLDSLSRTIMPLPAAQPIQPVVHRPKKRRTAGPEPVSPLSQLARS
jgi:hypothetical protein